MPVMPFVLAAAAASAPVAAPQAVAPAPYDSARPALWVVNDDDTIIYLFGTFHTLDAKTNWFDRSVRTAFFASDELVLETLVPKPPVMPGVNGTGTLSPLLRGASPLPVAQLAPSSFLGTTRMVSSAGRANGMSTDHGADAVLRDAADQTGKPVGGLETFEFQLNMFSSLPPPPGSGMKAHDPRMAKALGTALAQLQDAWSRGDVDVFAPMLRQMQEQSPQTYNRMFVERNARWAQWIAGRMKSPGTVLVAVGAGHFSGPDSVQRQLEALGVRSARIN
jgi:uncharacterized protein YbaP (TraB family)